MIPVSEALDRLFALVRPLDTETVALADAAGRVMVAPAKARRTQPPFAASAMDGYAVRAHQATLGATLPVVGEAAAGHRYPGPLPDGGAIRIFTGAPVPEGADTILIQEDAVHDSDHITIAQAPTLGAHIRPAGGDFTEGDELSAPRRLTSRDIALLAAMNVDRVRVTRRPIVALIPTGDELVQPGEEPGPDQIVTSNNYALAAMCQSAGAQARLCPIARDTPESLRDSLESARGADFIVTLGGASVGDHDLVAQVFGTQGLSLDFYKIAMRPGKPLMAGHLGDAVMLGLPGNPVSAIVCGEIFLRPALDVAMGLPPLPRRRSHAPLAHDLGKNGPREHYMRAYIDDDDCLTVFENQDSSLLGTLSRANALVVREPNENESPYGCIVPYIPL